MNQRRKQQQENHEREAWRLRVDKGMTQEAISNELGVTQQAVSGMLRRIGERLAKEFIEEAQAIRALHTCRLETVYRTAMEQWERSCEDSERITITSGRTAVQDGTTFHLPDLQATTTETCCGNPALLQAAMDALANVRKIWGLNAPTRQEWSGPSGSPVVFMPVRIVEVTVEQPALPEPE